jgi:Uncharacterized protein conserved in archaea
VYKMEEVKKKQAVSLSEVKELLKNQDPETMDQIQRWTFDYVSKVSTLEADSAKKMKQQLVKECDITEEEAVELINICPQTMSELQFFYIWMEKINSN